MSTYTGSAFATKYAAYLIYKGSATAAALNISQPKIGYVYDITEGGTLAPGNITVQQGDAVVYLAQGWTHCNNGGADQAIAKLSSQFDELLEEIGETDFSKFALKTELPTVPTDVSAFTNDAGYLTQHQSLANYALKTEIPDVSNLAPYSAIPQNVSQLTNDAHYLTEAVLNDRIRKVDDFDTDDKKTDGEIVQYIGETTNDYINGYFYKYTVGIDDFTVTLVNVQPETPVASGDAFLSQTDGAIGSTISIYYNSMNQHLELKGNNDAVVTFVDMAVFIKDGMLENVEKYTTPEQGVSVAVPYLKFTFNTDSGKSVIRISFADLIDTFDGSNVDLTSAFVKAAQYSAPAIGDSMNVAIGKLLKGHEDNATAIATKQDTLTFDDAPQSGSNRPVTSQGIKAAIDSAIGGVPNALKQVDLTTYQGTTNGEIVQHMGTTTSDYTDGYVYQFVGGVYVTVPTGTKYVEIPEGYPSAGLYYIEPSEERNPTKLWVFTANGSKSVYAPPFNKISVGSIICPMWLRVHTDVKTVDTVNNTFTFEVDGTTYTASNGSEYSAFNYSDYMHGIDNGNEITYGSGYEWVYKENGVYGVCFAQNDMYPRYSPYANVTTASEPTVIGGGGWQRINVQPSSEGAVSHLETRMTAAETAISGKQNALTFDDAPTENSGNPVTSGGVKTAIDVAPRFYLGTCSTAGNVAIKQVDIPNFPTTLVNGVETPIVGSVIAVKFSYSDAAAITQKKIKVNNTSAYPVWYSGAVVVERASSHIIFGSTNTYVNYVFDGTYWVWVNHGFDSTYTPISLGFGYAYCDTAAATAAKTASLSTYNLEKGGLVVVNFQYDVPAYATLNINNQGAKAIYFGSSRITSGVIKAGDKCLFIYNGNYMLIAIDRWGKELQEKVSGINISETDFEALSTYEQGKLYFVFDNNS